MKEKFIIEGGKPLNGIIEVRGSKNAATPILAATLLTKDECIIHNLPLIEDVFRMIEILESLGVRTQWILKRTLSLKADKVDPLKLNQDLVYKMRSSILVLGPLISRCGFVKICYPGGCNIGARPLDAHLDGFSQLGVKIKKRGNFYYFETPRQGLKANSVTVLKEFSVTATENLIMALSLIPGRHELKLAASEPHIQDLGKFLTSMGAKIKGLGTHDFRLYGKKKLKGAKHFLMPDPIEAGTFIILGVLTKGKILIRNIIPEHLTIFLKILREIGSAFNIDNNNISVKYSPRLKNFQVKTHPYPGFPTDLQSLMGVLATQAKGQSLIHETLYENRFNYIKELKKMGARVKIFDPHRVLISGPAKLKGINIESYDLRAGAALIIAGLIAKGETTIQDAYQVDRGYERIEERLSVLGADIRRV